MPLPAAAADIVAQAFRFMELAPPSSFADDTPQAADAAEQYPAALDTCLEACDWSFASVRARLAEARPGSQVEPDPDLPNVFVLPGDVILLREVGCRTTRWRLDRGGLLRADTAGPLPVRYTGRITNEAILPATFRTAVSLHLAILLAPRWLGTASKIDLILQQARGALKSAMRNDARMGSAESWSGRDLSGDWVAEALS